MVDGVACSENVNDGAPVEKTDDEVSVDTALCAVEVVEDGGVGNCVVDWAAVDVIGPGTGMVQVEPVQPGGHAHASTPSPLAESSELAKQVPPLAH